MTRPSALVALVVPVAVSLFLAARALAAAGGLAGGLRPAVTGAALVGPIVVAGAPGRLDDLVDRALQQEGALRDVVVLAVDDLLERGHGLLDGHVLALEPGELLRHEEGLREEALHLARPLNGHAVLVRELLDPEDRS